MDYFVPRNDALNKRNSVITRRNDEAIQTLNIK